MLVLALSTSTPRASVALLEGERVLAEVTYDDPRGHAERLFSLVDEAFAAAPGRSRAMVDLVACDVGPGSFTGVRIAVASAKGIAVALGVPLAGVLSLDAMIASARDVRPSDPRNERPSASVVVAAIDAKKDELYVAIHDGDAEILAPCHLPRGEVAARIAAVVADRPYVAAVETAELAAGWPDLEGAPPLLSVSPPSATWIARLAAASPASHQDPAEVVPLYVRAPDAVASFSVGPDPFAMLRPR